MTTLALSSTIEMAWWLSLGAGLVIAAVVVVLLHTLYRSVKMVERDVIRLWETATNLAQNTATSWMLKETGEVLEAVRAEALRHDELLSRRTR